MPENTVYVGRPTIWGNPFTVHDEPFNTFYPPAVEEGLILAYQIYLKEFEKKDKDLYVQWLKPLKGKNLACWCPLNKPCHADVLLEIANEI